jgi:hypothetical protein
MLPLFSSSFLVHHFKDHVSNWYVILHGIFNTFLLVPNFLPKKILSGPGLKPSCKMFHSFFPPLSKERKKKLVLQGVQERERQTESCTNFHMHLQRTKLLSYIGRWFSSFFVVLCQACTMGRH